MSDVPLETCWAFNELWNNKFRYQFASCWLLLMSQSNIKYHENPPRGRWIVPHGRTDTKKPLVAFRNLAIVPKLSEGDGKYVIATSKWPIFMEFRRNVRPLQATPTPYFTLLISNNVATCEPLTGRTASGSCFLNDAWKWPLKQAGTTALRCTTITYWPWENVL